MKSAVVFALIGSLMMPSMSVAGQEGASRSWSTIRHWEPGTEVTVRTPAFEQHRRHFIAADDAAITLLNLSGAGLPPNVAKPLLRIVVEHPEYFPVPDGKTVVLDKRVSLDSSGIFVSGQKVAEYSEIVERIARTDLEGGTVLVGASKGMSVSAQFWIGIALGFGLPAVIYSVACAVRRCD
jgi:hypothetical protein